jgi:hypothetical protein
MKISAKTKLPKGEEGQVLPWMALLMIVFIGAAGLTLDLGRGWVAYRQLQASADAAALAGVKAMAANNATVSAVQNATCQFSANGSTSNNCTMITTGTSPSTTTITKAGINTAPGLNSVTTTATVKCVLGVTYVPTTCSASNTGYNVIQVVERTTIPAFFIEALQSFGMNTGNSLTLNSTSSATLNGTMSPVNVAILVDTTNSMGQSDPTHCGGTAPSNHTQTKAQCAFLGVQTLLSELPACAQYSTTTGNCIAHNQVSLFTFPSFEAQTANDITTCTGDGTPTIMPYTWPAPSSWTNYGTGTNSYTAPTGTAVTYQITPFSSGYAGSSTGSLSTSSPVVIATGGTTSSPCTGAKTPGGDGTYYAGAINQAQEALMTASYGTTSKNIMIIMSDGDADSTKICKTWGSSGTPPTPTCTAYASNTSATYGSALDQCQQAIFAAQNATSQGTTVYSIAYQADTGGCGSDSTTYPGITGSVGSISACATMEWMSSNWPSNTSHFYSDGSSSSACGVGGGYTLPSIFSQIEAQFGAGMLIPNG